MHGFRGNDFREMTCFSLAAKSSNERRWLPFWAHQLDTAGIMEKLILNWLPGWIADQLSEQNLPGDFESVFIFAALVHDIGKATPVFQSRISMQSPALREKAENSALNIEGLSQYRKSSRTPHGYAGEAILLSMGCPAGIGAVVGAHHGAPFPAYDSPEYLLEDYEENFYSSSGKRSTVGRLWEATWSEWLKFSLDCCGYKSIEELPKLDVHTQMLLSGLLMMADWLASNESYAPMLDEEDPGDSLTYPERIEKIWSKVSLPGQWMPTSFFMGEEDFRARYGFLPNAMQKEIIREAEESLSPGIYIIEAQMGQGKTEAALAAAEIFASKWRCDGLFFGLPTQATANGIFPRLEHWAEGQTEDAQLSIKLSHGMAMLQKDYRELFHGTARQAEDENRGIFVHPWFEGRKQALLSTFVVGTVDQLLMAALKQKHVMLRHLGLAGKVVVIDECHAYDAYMNQYLERALEWLGAYRSPVILLSATLPAERRARLIEAYYGRKFAQQPDGWRESKAYPLLTYTDGETLHQVQIPVDTPDREITIVRSELDRLGGLLKDSLSGGGCAGVIVNTVAQAQSLVKKLREQLPEYDVMLAHARYTMADRMKREEELLRRLGKKSKAEERDGLIVVGTQLLEQSLDIDFDILATQLAPMDLLLQRIGRLHRHGTRDRPQALKKAMCIVCGFEERDSGSQQIYGSWLLERTARLLPEKLYLPGDISSLVQETYRDMEPGEELYPLWQEHRNLQLKKERKAGNYRMPRERDLRRTIHGLLDKAPSDNEKLAAATVRDGESSVAVLLMVKAGEDYAAFLPWQSAGERITLSHVPSEDECCKILQQRVLLPRQLSVYKTEECIRELEVRNSSIMPEWQRSRWLNGELVLLLSEELEAELCGYRLKYDLEYGLSICKGEEK